ncbi:MAG: hypothetical protein JWP19_1420 [Rhodoglobus sp.]|nr:hypothetical protein [Rhodoglobus sp.]
MFMRPVPLLLAIALVPLLAGCSAAPVSVASNTYPAVPNGYAETVNLFSAEPVAVWVHGHTQLAIVTVGSVDCAPIPTAISAPDAATIAITFVRSPNKPCSVDLSPTTHEFKLPAGVDVTGAVTVALHFDYETPVDYTLEVHD